VPVRLLIRNTTNAIKSHMSGFERDRTRPTSTTSS
jgi:hypothetical protein